jgi:hypothetical protein
VGRRPAGAGASPARRNQRWRVRSTGNGSWGRWRRSITRIRPAPHVGCSRRRPRAACTIGSGSFGVVAPQRSEEGCTAAWPPQRKRRSNLRTVRGAKPRAAAMVGPSWPSWKRRQMAWRTGTGRERGMGLLHRGRQRTGLPVMYARPDPRPNFMSGFRGPTLCRVTYALPRPPIHLYQIRTTFGDIEPVRLSKVE